MAVKQVLVSLALPSVKGLVECSSDFRHSSLFVSLYKEQYIMKGKCKSLSLLETVDQIKAAQSQDSCEFL